MPDIFNQFSRASSIDDDRLISYQYVKVKLYVLGKFKIVRILLKESVQILMVTRVYPK